MKEIQRDLNALVILILSGVLLSAFGVQFIWKEEPCPLCMLQRIGMISVAAGLMLNLIFGVHMSHYALCLLGSFLGGFVALRQISLHVCPGFSQFGLPVLGMSLYTWSFIVFVCCVLAVSLLLFLYNPRQSEEPMPTLNLWSKFACWLIFLITVANVITTFLQCGLGAC
jgi:disulfide bond formation protein DsbB